MTLLAHMSQDKPELFTAEMAKNAKKGVGSELMGAAIGAGLGAVFASIGKLKNTDFAVKVVDMAFFGLLGGIIGRLWREKSDNQASALKLDAKMIHLEQENKLLHEVVTEQGRVLHEPAETHAEKLKSERAADKECSSCRFKK